MSAMSRTRQRECLAQRGKRRKGRQKSVVRNYVAEMGNNLWSTKFPAFAKLDATRRKEYWSKIFKAYKSMYAKASAQPETKEDDTRAEQLVAMTEKVYERKHVYQTEVFQLQDLCISENGTVSGTVKAKHDVKRLGCAVASQRITRVQKEREINKSPGKG